MFSPSVTALRRYLHPGIAGCTVREIKGSRRSRVYRVALSYGEGHPGPASVVVKVLAARWPDDPHGPRRELTFYRDLLPRLELPHPRLRYGGVVEGSGERLLIMEDLAPRYRFPRPRYVWTEEEVRTFLRTYARLHVAGREVLPPASGRAWLLKPWHARLEAVSLRAMVADLVIWGVWEPLPGVGTLIERTVADVSRLSLWRPTLLHNDLYPPNVALPHDPEGEALLLDWEMASWGLAELDLAYLFLQPFRSARNIDRGAALESYWGHRRALEEEIPTATERGLLQHHADAVLALALVGVAHRVARKPFPEGSAPRAYWDAMFGVLEARLHDLAGQARRVHAVPALVEAGKGIS